MLYRDKYRDKNTGSRRRRSTQDVKLSYEGMHLDCKLDHTLDYTLGEGFSVLDFRLNQERESGKFEAAFPYPPGGSIPRQSGPRVKHRKDLGSVIVVKVRK